MIATLPSGRMRGGKVEEVKFLRRALTRYQKEREEEEFERLLHLVRMKDFLVSRITDLARFRAEI